MNPMNQYPPRPELDDEIVKAAVEEFMANNPALADECGPDAVDQIVDAYDFLDDGFALSRKLDRDHWWDCDRETMEALDGVDWLVHKQIKKRVVEWIESNNIQQPYPDGTRVICKSRNQEGVIDGVCEHSPGCFRVAPSNPDQFDKDHSTRWVCEFESVELVKEDAA